MKNIVELLSDHSLFVILRIAVNGGLGLDIKTVTCRIHPAKDYGSVR